MRLKSQTLRGVILKKRVDEELTRDMCYFYKEIMTPLIKRDLFFIKWCSYFKFMETYENAEICDGETSYVTDSPGNILNARQKKIIVLIRKVVDNLLRVERKENVFRIMRVVNKK